MTRLALDTPEEIENIQIELLRQMPAWRKLALFCDLYEMGILLATSGLRARHPEASEAELKRRLADLLLGEDLALRVYGPFNPQETTWPPALSK